jgi:hypothetical protein
VRLLQILILHFAEKRSQQFEMEKSVTRLPNAAWIGENLVLNWPQRLP